MGFSDHQGRRKAYVFATVVIFALAVAARGYDAWRNNETFHMIVSDAKMYYVYLPSFIIEGNLDFRSEIIRRWGEEFDPEDLEQRTARGMVMNKMTSGMAQTLLPPFLLAHGILLAVGQAFGDSHHWLAPDGYSPLYQLLCLAFVLALSCCTMLLIDRLIERHFDVDGRLIAAGVLVCWFGSHYIWYCVREPFMVHVISAFWVTAVIYLCAKIRRSAAASPPQLRAFDIFLLSFAMSMALACRPSNIFVAPFLAWAALGVWRAGLVGRSLRALPAAVPGFLPLVLQMLVWRHMHGEWLHYSYGDEKFLWTQPALFQTLFSLNKGLFVWTPLLLLSAAGVAWHMLRRPAPHKDLIACWLLSAAILWYINSSWWAWGFGWSFGHRAFLELLGLFIIGLTFAFQWAKNRPGAARNAVIGAVVAFGMFNYMMIWLYQTERIPRGGDLGGGWNPQGAPQRTLLRVERLRAEQKAILTEQGHFLESQRKSGQTAISEGP